MYLAIGAGRFFRYATMTYLNLLSLIYPFAIFAPTAFLSPPLALLAGIVCGICFGRFPLDARKLSLFLLQASVVALGFGMNLHDVLHAGAKGFVYSATSILFTLGLGLALGGVFRVRSVPSLLISVGTAICGGSAIAAVGPVLNAGEEEMTVSLGTVFVLNAIALFVFPAIGAKMHLTQTQFGLWSALAIHDTSSVVGATAKYGPVALMVGTTVKLARALWIVPITIAVAVSKKHKARVKWPWFILLFCAAAVASTYLSKFASVYQQLFRTGRIGLMLTLFLIGASITRPMLRKIGIRPLIVGSILWLVVATLTLCLVLSGVIYI